MPEELKDPAITESEAVAFGEKLAGWASQQSPREQAMLVAMLDSDDVVGLEQIKWYSGEVNNMVAVLNLGWGLKKAALKAFVATFELWP